MTIEFNCPNCNAIIRVPDNAAGGKGRCPRCNTRIKVPKASTPRTPPKEAGPELEFFAQAAEQEADSEVLLESAESFAEAPPSDEIFAPRSVGLGELPDEPTRRPLQAGSISSKVKRKKGSGGWQAAVVCGLALCGVFGWYYWQQQQSEKLSGELTAETAAALELKPVELSASMFKRTSEEMKPFVEGLHKSPVPLRSTLMTVHIGASKKAVTVDVSAGTQTGFYRVDIQNDPALLKFRSTHGPEYEAMRSAAIEFAGPEFLRTYQHVLDKESGPGVLNEYRDSLVLPALVRGLGYQLAAVFQQKPYRCVYEDGDGGLYFLMPPGASEFELVGRVHADGKTVFNGKYTVKVKGEFQQPAKDKPDKQAKDSTDPIEDAPGLSEVGGGKKKKRAADSEEDGMEMEEKPRKKMPAPKSE